MNRPLRKVALACLLLFGLLLVNVNYVQVVKAEQYRDDPRNSRVLLRTYERARGPIAVVQPGGGRSASRSPPAPTVRSPTCAPTREVRRTRT